MIYIYIYVYYFYLYIRLYSTLNILYLYNTGAKNKFALPIIITLLSLIIIMTHSTYISITNFKFVHGDQDQGFVKIGKKYLELNIYSQDVNCIL